MALFAKILIFFNLIAGGAFVYLAVEDWTYRQKVSRSVLRHQLLVVGLPLQEEDIPPPDPEEPDPAIPFHYISPAGAVTETVSRDFLTVYFKPATGSRLGGAEIINSQLGEVRRVQKLVTQSLNAPDANKAFAAASYLLPLAYTLEERQKISQLKASNQGDELASMLAKKFDEILNPAPNLDEGARRMKIADLLLNLDPESAWQQRVALVVGLRRYRSSIAAQALRFEQMINQIERIIEHDQDEYFKKVIELKRLAIDNTQALMDSEKRKISMQDQQVKDTEHRNQIKTQVDKLTARLADWTGKVNAALAQQTAAEKKLFDYQRMVGSTLEDIFRLESELIRLEEAKLGGDKP